MTALSVIAHDVWGSKMKANRLLATTMLAGGIALAGPAATALADPYAPTPVSPERVTDGGYCPGGTVTVVVTEDGVETLRKQVSVDAGGRVSTTVPGSDDALVQFINEVCPPVVQGVRVPSNDLPRTGGSLTPLWAGAGLVGSGALLMMAFRSRRRADA